MLKELNLNSDEKVTWLAKENLLIKRAVIIFDKNIIVGYNEELYLQQLL